MCLGKGEPRQMERLVLPGHLLSLSVIDGLGEAFKVNLGLFTKIQ